DGLGHWDVRAARREPAKGSRGRKTALRASRKKGRGRVDARAHEARARKRMAAHQKRRRPSSALEKEGRRIVAFRPQHGANRRRAECGVALRPRRKTERFEVRSPNESDARRRAADARALALRTQV